MTFTLLFLPETDPLTVIGPNNATYWLMLVVRSDSIHNFKNVYYLGLAIEIFALLVGYTLHIRGFLLFWKIKPIHINFLLIAVGAYTVMIIGTIARFVTIPYEMRIVQFSGLYEPLILFLSILRQASYAQALSILWAWSIERLTFATIYVVDYEKNKRVQISIILITLSITCSYVIGYTIVIRIFNGLILCAVAFLFNIASALVFRLLCSYNSNRLSRLTHNLKRYPDEYSLSLRIQLKENISTMKKIEFGVYAYTSILAANLVLIFVPTICLTQPDQFEMLQWLTCMGNLIIAFSILATSPLLEVAVSIHTGKESSIMRVMLGREYFHKKTPAVKKEIDEYFTQLDSQWSYGLILHNSRISDK